MDVKTPSKTIIEKQKKALAAKFEARDKATLAYINEFLGTNFTRRPYVQMNCTRRMIESFIAGDRPFPNSKFMRVDGYKNAIKVQCVAVMNLDLATNTILAVDSVSRKLIPAGNSLFANLLNMPLRTVDEAVAALKRFGVYLSNERFKFTLDDHGKKVFEGAHSIKRVCLGVFNVFDLEKAVNRAIERAKGNRAIQMRQKQHDAAKDNRSKEKKLGKNYKNINELKSTKRAEKRLKAKIDKSTATWQAPAKPSNTQEQLDAYLNGTSHTELKALYASPIDTGDDIPY